MPLALFESGAILLYLADKAARFIPADPAGRWHMIQWLMWQMSGLGPTFGQVGFFHKFAGKEWEDKRPLDHYVAEAQRLLGVLDGQLEDRPWIVGGNYTIADIATLGWMTNLVGFYEAGKLVGFERYRNVKAWLQRGLARPAVERELVVASLGLVCRRSRPMSRFLTGG